MIIVKLFHSQIRLLLITVEALGALVPYSVTLAHISMLKRSGSRRHYVQGLQDFGGSQNTICTLSLQDKSKDNYHNMLWSHNSVITLSVTRVSGCESIHFVDQL